MKSEELMSEITNPHDRFFKELFGQPQIVADFLRYYLPADVVAVLDVSAPEPLKDGFVDPELQQHLSDLLYRVRLREGPEAFVYVLFEHKSAPEIGVAFQLLRYLVRIWEMLLAAGAKELPPIYPVVFYHGRARWNAAPNFRALVAIDEDSPLLKHVPEFEYHLVDLAALDEDALQGAPYLRAGLLLFRHIFNRELKRRLPDIFQQLSGEPRQTLVEHLKTIMIYLKNAADRVTTEDVKEALTQTSIHSEGDKMDSFFDVWIQQGRLEGWHDGLASMTLRLLQKKFGSLPDALQQQVGQLSTEQVEELGEAVLDFGALAELEIWLQQRQPVN